MAHLMVLIWCLGAPLALILGLIRQLRGGLLVALTAFAALWLLLEVLVVVGVGVSGELTVARVVLAELVPAGLGAWWRQRCGPSDLPGRVLAAVRASAGGPPSERWLLITIGAVGAAALAVMLLTPSGDYDSWMYQLPQVAEWTQQHCLGAFQDQWRDTPTFARLIIYYPGNWTALFWLCTAPMHSDVLTLLPTALGWVLLGLSSAALVRLAHGSRACALAGAALVMTIPLAGSNLHSAHVDLGQGAVLAALLTLTVNALGTGCVGSALLAVGLAGMLVGTKMSGIPQLAAPALLAAILWRGRTAVQGWSWALAAIALGCAAAGGWWYLHNWQLTGNPFGWVAIPALGFHGAVDHAYIARTTLLHTFKMGNARHWALVIGALVASGGGLTALAVVGIPQRCWRGASRLEWGLTAVAALLACQYIIGPWSGKPALDADLSWWLQQQLRYTWAIWALLAALVAIAADRGRWNPWLITVIAMASAAYLPFTTYAWTVALPALVIGAGLTAACLQAWASPAGRLAWWQRLALPLLALGLVLCGEPLRWRLLDQHGYGVPGMLERQLPPGATVAFWGSHQSWLLYGRTLEHRVHYVYLPCIEPETPTASDADPSVTVSTQLRAAGIPFLALGPKWTEFPATTYRSFESHPELFHLVHGDPMQWGMCIYAVEPAAPAPAAMTAH